MTIDDTYAARLSLHTSSYIRRRRSWEVVFRKALAREVRSNDLPPDIDGILANLNTVADAKALQAYGAPLVNLGDELTDLPLPLVCVDNEAVGRLGAEYLLHKGVRQFACIGVKNRRFACGRWNAFNQTLIKAGHEPARYFDLEYDRLGNVVPEARNFAGEPLEIWLKRLPRPCGIFCVSDPLCQMAADACRVNGIHVPEECLLLGVDNIEALCTSTQPPLSSIEQPLEQIAERAVERLEQLIEHPENPQAPIESLKPLQVVERRSSEVLAIDDPLIRRTIAHIREHAHETLTVEDIAKRLHTNRSSLDRRFRARLGTTVKKEIVRARINRAKQLLMKTDAKLEDIAPQCGFSGASRLAIVFAQETGFPPGAYRRNFNEE